MSRELSPLDHRGNNDQSTEPIVEKKLSSKRSSDGSNSRDVSNSKSSVPRSQCLSGVIYPLMSEVCFFKFTSATKFDNKKKKRL